MERLTIDELIAHCDRQLDRLPSGNKVYQEHESTRAYLQILRHYIAIGTVERLTELVKAQSEGRVEVLPCKVGDPVKVDARTWGESWNYKATENGKFLLGEIVSIIKTKKQLLMKIRVEHNVGWRRPMKRYPVSAIGKTVFLTRTEAKAALGGGGDGE